MRGKNAVKNIISLLLLQVATVVCGFIVPKLIIEHYGSATNGLVNSITQFLAYITFLESGFGPVVKSVLYKPIAKNDKETIRKILRSSEKFFRKIGVIFLAYVVVLCIVYPLIVDAQFDAFFSISLIVVIALSIFAEYFFGMTYGLFLQAEQRTYITSRIQIFTTILAAVATVVLIEIGASVQVAKLGAAVMLILKPIILNIYIKRKYNIHLEKEDDEFVIKQKWDGLAQHIAFVIHSNTDVVVLSMFSTMKEVSVYSVYMLVVKGIRSVVQAFINGIDASFGDMLAKKEHDNLQRKFRMYEYVYHTISSIILISTILLITQFVGVYMKGVTDADYTRPVFGILISVAEYIWAIRLPYSSLTLAAGHFKQTRRGAWVEAIVNISISVALVFSLGIVGVAIGTVVSTFIRSAEFMVYSSKHILRREVLKPFVWLILAVVESVAVFALVGALNLAMPDSYGAWAKNAIVIVAITTLVVFGLNTATHKSELKDVKKILKKTIKRI
ncbi:MAG: polysaccharide biosynthesis protein [Methanobrevibacter sp.]|nr:polysaccharide biosynthesis protein [Methanobrevibacter sp.]